LYITILISLYFFGKEKADKQLCRYPLKSLNCIGFYIVDEVGVKVWSRALRHYEFKIRKIYFEKTREESVRILSNKITLGLLGILISLIAVTGDSSRDGLMTLYYATLTVGLLMIPDYILKRNIKCRTRSIESSFPKFVCKLLLLVEAGVTIEAAIRNIVNDQHLPEERKNQKLDEFRDGFYMELRNIVKLLDSGVAFEAALETFAHHCRDLMVNKFVSIVIQSHKNGNSEVALVLSILLSEVWEKRKNVAKVLGEEAGSKLVLPMMIMLIGIMGMIVYPALQQMNGF